MEEYVDSLKEYLGSRRNLTKKVYVIVGTLYRGVTRGRFTYEQGLNKLNSLLTENS